MPETVLQPSEEQPAGMTTLTCTPVLQQSLSQPYQTTVPPVERPGFTSITTPIDALARPYLLPFLHAHGATTEVVSKNLRYIARLPSGRKRPRTYSMYQITFPEGMQCLDGLSTSWLVPFTLVFPDGARLDGRINMLSQPAAILLGLPVESLNQQKRGTYPAHTQTHQVAEEPSTP